MQVNLLKLYRYIHCLQILAIHVPFRLFGYNISHSAKRLQTMWFSAVKIISIIRSSESEVKVSQSTSKEQLATYLKATAN